MTETYPCGDCSKEFESLDSWANHLHEEHGIPEGGIQLSYTRPENSEKSNQTLPEQPQPGYETRHPAQPQGQQVENPVRAMVENPEETEELIDTLFNRWQESKEQSLRHRWKMILIVAGLFIAVLISSSILTYTQILQGSAYTLLLGTLIGYLLTFLEDYL